MLGTQEDLLKILIQGNVERKYLKVSVQMKIRRFCKQYSTLSCRGSDFTKTLKGPSCKL